MRKEKTIQSWPGGSRKMILKPSRLGGDITKLVIDPLENIMLVNWWLYLSIHVGGWKNPWHFDKHARTIQELKPQVYRGVLPSSSWSNSDMFISVRFSWVWIVATKQSTLWFLFLLERLISRFHKSHWTVDSDPNSLDVDGYWLTDIVCLDFHCITIAVNWRIIYRWL
jgi:hypothetical protein